jgi:hypothetical protein
LSIGDCRLKQIPACSLSLTDHWNDKNKLELREVCLTKEVISIIFVLLTEQGCAG